MMGSRQVAQEALFYEFTLDGTCRADHLLRSIDRFVDLVGHRRDLRRFTARRAGPRSIRS